MKLVIVDVKAFFYFLFLARIDIVFFNTLLFFKNVHWKYHQQL